MDEQKIVERKLDQEIEKIKIDIVLKELCLMAIQLRKVRWQIRPHSELEALASNLIKDVLFLRDSIKDNYT